MEKFSYETNGYNRSEVNQFVSDVISVLRYGRYCDERLPNASLSLKI